MDCVKSHTHKIENKTDSLGKNRWAPNELLNELIKSDKLNEIICKYCTFSEGHVFFISIPTWAFWNQK